MISGYKLEQSSQLRWSPRPHSSCRLEGNFNQMQSELLEIPKGLTKATWGSANFQDAVFYDHKPDIGLFMNSKAAKSIKNISA